METARVPAASCEEAIDRWEDMCKEVQLLNHKLEDRVECTAFGIPGVPVEYKTLDLEDLMDVTSLKSEDLFSPIEYKTLDLEDLMDVTSLESEDLFSQIEEQSEGPKSECNTLELESPMDVTSQEAADLLPHVETERVPAVSDEEPFDRWCVMSKEVQLLNDKLKDRVTRKAFGIHGVPVESKTLELMAQMNLTNQKADDLFLRSILHRYTD